MSDLPHPPECAERQVTFTTFVLSLSTAALEQLGYGPEEAAQKPAVNLCLARQTIDLLEMLESKTKGNLSEDEGRLLTSILYDLRIRFVQTSKGECR